MRQNHGKYKNAKPSSPHRGGKMAFMLSRFPLVDETFILREMTALANATFDFEIYSLKKPCQVFIQKAALELMPRMTYRRYLWSWDVLAAQFYFLLHAAPTYLSTLLIFIAEMWNRPQSLAKCFMLFPKAVCYARLMQRRQVVHIHAFWATFPCTMAWIAHRLIGVPYSFSAHAHDIYEDNSMLVRKLRETEFVMTCTQYNHTFLSKLVPEKKSAIKLIYHGQDLEPFREDAQRRDPPSEVFRILSIGTFYKTKGFDTLIEACAMLKRQGFHFQCKIVGNGPERKRLERLIATHALQEQVLMLGYLTQEEIRPLRRWADVFILLPRPYLHWGLPNVFIEALATRLAVIATPLNAIGELVKHEQTGLIVENDDPPAAAAALMRLSREPELRERMVTAGQKLAFQLFDAHRTSQQVCNLFAEKIGRRQESAKPVSRSTANCHSPSSQPRINANQRE
jgi:glycosyltransferase involved in cell wall biosynthesis